METESVLSEIDFSDAELAAYTKRADTLTVEILAWDESTISIVFTDVIRFLDNDANSIKALCKVSNSEFLKAALKRLYEGPIPKDHPYVHYQFLDIDDAPALEAVCTQMSVARV